MSTVNAFVPPVLGKNQPTQDKWREERRAFLALLPELLHSYRGRFVAVHEGRVVASGDDKVSLGQAVYEKHGYVPIYVGLVAEQPETAYVPYRRPFQVTGS